MILIVIFIRKLEQLKRRNHLEKGYFDKEEKKKKPQIVKKNRNSYIKKANFAIEDIKLQLLIEMKIYKYFFIL